MKKIYVLEYTTQNLGDDIQSISTMDILDDMGIQYSFINRDLINEYNFDSNCENYVILNGWFTNGYGLEEYYRSPSLRDQIKITWPPKNNFKPIFYSFHISEWGPSHNREVNYKFLDEESQNFYKSFDSVGCRDNHTLNIMKKLNVNSYLSRCLTLSLNKDKYLSPNLLDNEILFVDVPEDYVSDLNKKIKKIYKTYKINKLTHKISETELSHDRFNLGRKHLRFFCNAKLVITTRLHVALPCLAFGTPVIFLLDDNDYNNSRIVDYLPYLNFIKFSQISKVNLNKYLNPKYDQKKSIELKNNFKNIIKNIL